MKSLNSQDQWTWKFALKFFLALLLNNVLFISENFLQNAIAQPDLKPQPTIPYPYKLFPNQTSEDCAIREDTDFHFDKTERKITNILQWTPLEKKVWLTICEGKPFDSLSYLLDDNWLDDFNELEKETKQKDYKCQLDREKITISKLKISLDCFKRYINEQEVTDEKIINKLNKLSIELENKTQISKNFLNTILLREPFRSALPNKVIIKNVIFTEEVDLSSTNINVELHLEESVFQKKVNFGNSKFFKSLYFDGSTFEDIVLINDAFIEGSLFLRQVILRPNSHLLQEEKNINLLNLSGIRVNGKVNLQNQRLEINDESILANVTPLNLRTAQIGVSIEMQGSCWPEHDPNFDHCIRKESDDKDFDSRDSENSPQIVTDTVKQGGNVKELVLAAVKIGDALIINNETKFTGLNLSNSEIPYFIINIPKKEYKDIDNINTLIDYLSSPNPIVNFFRKSQPNNNQPTLNKLTKVKINFEDARISNFQINPRVHTSSNKSQFFTHIEDENKKTCNFDLDGFVYEDVNFAGFNLLNFCLDSKYKQILKKDNDQAANKLLQPLDHIAIISRDLGRYRVEDELLYRRKRLELVIAEESRLFWEWLQLNIGDLLYGFGYKRTKILRLFLIFLFVGIACAYIALKKKQKSLLEKTIELRTNEIEDELRDQLLQERRYQLKEFEGIKPHLDYVDRIIFHGHINSDSNEQEKIYLGFKPELDANELVKNRIFGNSDNEETDKIEFVKIILADKDGDEKKKIIKYIVENVDERNKNNRKVGICENLLPNSGWHLIYSLEKNTNNLYYIYTLENEKGEYFSCTDIGLKYTSILILAVLSVVVTEVLIILILAVLSIIIINLVKITIVERKNIFKKIKKLRLIFRISLISRKSWIKSFIYSLDSLIPLIELDQELKDFIVEDSEGLPKGYFIFQQILGTIIASILLPILFITGL